MSEEKQQLYEFGEFRLDPAAGELRRGAERVGLPPKVFEILCVLAESRGATVSKDELMQRVWADSFVEEANLTQNIYTLRRALGKTEENQNLIENVPRRGYRIAAPVRVVSADEKAEEISNNGKTPEAEFIAAEPTFKDGKADKAAAENQHPKSGVRHPAFLIGGAIAVLILLVAGFAAVRFLPSAAPPESPMEKVSFEKLTFSGDISYPVIAPDGNSFAFVKDGKIFLQDLQTGTSTPLPVADHTIFGYLQFSPDGETIYFRNQRRFDLAGDIFAVRRAGGETARILENAWAGFSPSPDGKQFALWRFYPPTGEFGFVVKTIESKAEQELFRRKPPAGFYYNAAPAWTADGEKIAVVFQNQLQDYASTLVVVSPKTGKIEEIPTPRLKQIEHAAWLPGGENLIIAGRENHRFFQLWRIAYPSGELQKITNDLNIYRGLSLSSDGKRLLARQFSLNSHLWVAAAEDLQNLRQLTFGNLNRDGHSGLSWTPSGEIVYTNRIMGDIDLWSISPETVEPRRLTQNAGDTNEQPFATADGKYIFYNSSRSDGKHVWRMDVSGANQTQITFGDTETEFSPVVSPDSESVYFLHKGAQMTSIRRKSLVNGDTRTLTAPDKFAPNGAPSLSPDGKLLAFYNVTENTQPETGKQILQIVVMSTDGEGEPRLFNISASIPTVRWTNDGAAFDYVENAGGEARVWRQPLTERAAPKLILRLPNTQIFDFAWSADGKSLALSRGQQQNDAVLLTNFNP